MAEPFTNLFAICDGKLWDRSGAATPIEGRYFQFEQNANGVVTIHVSTEQYLREKLNAESAG